MSSSRAVWPWYTGAALLIVLDQVTKILVRLNFDLHESLALIGKDLVRLTYVLNPGIAFGLRVPGPTLLIIFGWVAAAILAAYLFLLVRRGDPLRWPVTLFLAGAVGNSIDRALFGQVTDFVDVDFPNFIMERWPVFNVADSCVSIGIVWMLVLMLFFHRHVAEPSHSQTVLGERSDPAGSRVGVHPVSGDDRTRPAANTD